MERDAAEAWQTESVFLRLSPWGWSRLCIHTVDMAEGSKEDLSGLGIVECRVGGTYAGKRGNHVVMCQFHSLGFAACTRAEADKSCDFSVILAGKIKYRQFRKPIE